MPEVCRNFQWIIDHQRQCPSVFVKVNRFQRPRCDCVAFAIGHLHFHLQRRRIFSPRFFEIQNSHLFRQYINKKCHLTCLVRCLVCRTVYGHILSIGHLHLHSHRCWISFAFLWNSKCPFLPPIRQREISHVVYPGNFIRDMYIRLRKRCYPAGDDVTVFVKGVWDRRKVRPKQIR